MVQRRTLVGGGVVAGLTALMAPEAEAAQQRDNSEVVSRAVQELRDTLESHFSGPWLPIARVRQQQRIWLQANHRYPEFIEIGVEIWESLYDWHVRFQQPVNMARTTDGRYVMSYMFTTFILRPDAMANYIGSPFDSSDVRRPTL
jgi:hypothetical protein